MPKSLALIPVVAMVLTAGCSQLTLRGGISDYEPDDESVYDGASGLGGGVALESNLTRYATFETGIYTAGEVIDGVNGEDGTIDQHSVEMAFMLNLVPDQRSSDRFLMDVGPAQHDDDDVPWLLSPLRWLEKGIPWLVPFVTVGGAYAIQDADIGGVSDDENSVLFRYGGGVKINIDDINQLSISYDRFNSRSTKDQWVAGDHYRLTLGYSLGF